MLFLEEGLDVKDWLEDARDVIGGLGLVVACVVVTGVPFALIAYAIWGDVPDPF